MGYSDQKYYSRPLIKIASAVAFGTATGSGTASNSLAQPSGVYLETFLRKSQVVGFEVVCVSAPGGTQIGPVNFTVLNGTNTVGFVAVQTATAGQTFMVGGFVGGTNGLTGTATVSGSLNINNTGTATYAYFGTGSAPTIAMIGTYTASGATTGTWDLWLNVKEIPDISAPGQ